MATKKKNVEEKTTDLMQKQVVKGLFDDYYRQRRKVYVFNFWRGLFFGAGSFLGGTIVIAIVIWLLGRFVDMPGWVGQFVESVVKIIEKKQV
jgi:uncharacterized membrane protein